MFQFDGRQSDQRTGHTLWASQGSNNALARGDSTACTIRDVARLAGVSIATVSRVTSSSVNVSGQTREKVLAAASALQYYPNPQAAELASRKDGRQRKGRSHIPSSTGTKENMGIQSGAD